jgi:uncharacterized metal-binding protein
MPDDRGHNKLNVIFIIGAAPIAIYYFGVVALAGIAAFMFAGTAFNPDLDLESDPYNHWWFLKWYWYLYQYLIPHRGWISHSPIIGTLVRLIYLSPVVAVILSALVITELTSIEKITEWYVVNKKFLISAAAGLEASSLLHIIADKISTWFKRTF